MECVLFFFLFTSPLFCHRRVFTVAADDDTVALSLFRFQADPHGVLASNWTTTATASTACAACWVGVKCINHRVTGLILPAVNLRGPIGALSSLQQLRFLDLRDNRLNRSIFPITQCHNLKLVYLSGNEFSGGIPQEISSLHRLLRLDLAENNLRGPIPSEIEKLQHLVTLNLQNNQLSGPIPSSLDSLPRLRNLNLSNNELWGPIPWILIFRFGGGSFSGNEGLCGSSPFPRCSVPPRPPSSETVPSNPISLPPTQHSSLKNHRKLSNKAVVSIIAVNSVVLLFLLTSFAVAFCFRSLSRGTISTAPESESGKRSTSSGGANTVGENGAMNPTIDKSKLVFFDRAKEFEMEDLLRASAEMLGKGSLGTVYRAVLDDGDTVAVKRLKDSNPCSRKEFEQYMEIIGKVKHPNIVKFRAFYYAREEKLLIYDYLPNGSLHSLLHGNREPGRIPLDWTTRIGLILGTARGLAKIHDQYSSSRIPHGNVKSSNILLNKNGIAQISDFGLALLLSPARAIERMNGYTAPEQSDTKKLSQKADVYSFGVVLLEILTGRVSTDHEDLAAWVRSVVRNEWTGEVFDPELLRYKNIEEELVSMLHVAMACTAAEQRSRPEMVEVVRLIEEIGVEQSPVAEDYEGGSRCSVSPSFAAITEDTMS